MSIAIVFYLNSYLLIPHFLNKKRFWVYLIFFFSFLVLAAIVNKHYAHFYNISLDRLKHHPRPDGKIRFIWSGTFFALVSSVLFSLIKKYNLQEEQKLVLQNQQIKAELSMLKAQVNPHFLFNTLNNIYAVAIDKAEPIVSELILSLSEITRYMLYETEPEFVPLEKEIFYLNSYIELEKLRCEHTKNISVLFAKNAMGIKISPLILIPFIENAFKHSRISDDLNAFINISLNVCDGVIMFECENSIPISTFSKDRTKGIGLVNVKKRLHLIYANAYSLKVSDASNSFRVQLEIQAL